MHLKMFIENGVKYDVTVPVRGIRLHLKSLVHAANALVTVPVRGIRLHREDEMSFKTFSDGYCPREGYKVAS